MPIQLAKAAASKKKLGSIEADLRESVVSVGSSSINIIHGFHKFIQPRNPIGWDYSHNRNLHVFQAQLEATHDERVFVRFH